MCIVILPIRVNVGDADVISHCTPYVIESNNASVIAFYDIIDVSDVPVVCFIAYLCSCKSSIIKLFLSNMLSKVSPFLSIIE